jgi:hypothetical protein
MTNRPVNVTKETIKDLWKSDFKSQFNTRGIPIMAVEDIDDYLERKASGDEKAPISGIPVNDDDTIMACIGQGLIVDDKIFPLFERITQIAVLNYYQLVVSSIDDSKKTTEEKDSLIKITDKLKELEQEPDSLNRKNGKIKDFCAKFAARGPEYLKSLPDYKSTDFKKDCQEMFTVGYCLDYAKLMYDFLSDVDMNLLKHLLGTVNKFALELACTGFYSKTSQMSGFIMPKKTISTARRITRAYAATVYFAMKNTRKAIQTSVKRNYQLALLNLTSTEESMLFEGSVYLIDSSDEGMASLRVNLMLGIIQKDRFSDKPNGENEIHYRRTMNIATAKQIRITDEFTTQLARRCTRQYRVTGPNRAKISYNIPSPMGGGVTSTVQVLSIEPPKDQKEKEKGQ